MDAPTDEFVRFRFTWT